MKQYKEPLAFLGLTFALMYIPAGAYIFFKPQIASAFEVVFGGVSPYYLLYLAAFSPTLAAIILTATWGGRTALKDLLLRTFRWNVGIKWWLTALLLFPSIWLAWHVFKWVAGFGGPVQWDLWYSVLPLHLFSFAAVLGVAPWSEEIGWRGYLTPKLLQLHSPFVVSLIVGTVWSLWHIPGWFIVEIGYSGMNFLAYLPAAIMISIMMTWILIHTKMSILLAGLIFHRIINATGDDSIPMWKEAEWEDLIPLLIAIAIILWPARHYFFKKPHSANQLE